jgi:UDPglucose 6-dehydrogenase
MQQTYDYKRIYDNMLKPAFLFDGRMILDHHQLVEIGFDVTSIGRHIKRNKKNNRQGAMPKP